MLIDSNGDQCSVINDQCDTVKMYREETDLLCRMWMSWRDVVVRDCVELGRRMKEEAQSRTQKTEEEYDIRNATCWFCWECRRLKEQKWLEDRRVADIARKSGYRELEVKWAA